MRATVHARNRLEDRFGLQLTSDQWDEIVKNARAGDYELSARKSAPPGVGCMFVPMGNPGGLVHWIPMVINTKIGIVVTVLPPGSA